MLLSKPDLEASTAALEVRIPYNFRHVNPILNIFFSMIQNVLEKKKKKDLEHEKKETLLWLLGEIEAQRG